MMTVKKLEGESIRWVTITKTHIHTRLQSGFTLVKMIMVVAIVSILLALALPSSHQDQIRCIKRSDGKGYLMELQAAQERFFAQDENNPPTTSW